jgi:hypothetical protein
MVPRRLFIAAACLAAILALPATAGADWQALPTPADGVSSVAAVDGSTILIQHECCGPAFAVTSDRGGTWHDVQLGGHDFGSVAGIAPDGSFRVVAADLGESGGWVFQVYSVTTAGDAQPLGPPILDDTNSFSGSRFAAADDGSVWLPVYDETARSFELVIVAADGSTTTHPLPAIGAENWYPRRSALGMRLLAAGGSGYPPGLPRRGTYKLDEGGLSPAEAFPVEFADGQFWYSPWSERVSWDAGAHWDEVFDLPSIVPSRSGPPRFLSVDGTIAEPYSSSLYRGSGLGPPSGQFIHGIVDAGDALVAAAGETVYVAPLPLPPPPAEIGQVPDVARQMIARANLFRADAGLPSLIGDAAISQASLNHSAYTAANPDETAGLGAHHETPGHPGFTGRDLSERCAAVGASCFGEVMYSPVVDPVGGWLATIYHRFVPGAPQVGLVGAGKADGGWFVMNSGADRNVLIQPFGYPNGRWRGAEGFGGEIPDPVEVCQGQGQNISYPVGIAVTLYIPDQLGTVERIEVRKRGSAEPLRGCQLGGGFRAGGVAVLDDPLERGATYDVTAVWRPEAEALLTGGTIPAAPLTHNWSFYYQPENSASGMNRERRCQGLGLRRIRSVAPSRRRGRKGGLGLEERIALKQKGRVRLRRARLTFWTAGTPHPVKLKLGREDRRWHKVGRVSFLRLRLPSWVRREVMPGEEAELRLTFVGRPLKGCRRHSPFRSVRKVKIGWVRVQGRTDWVSPGTGR